MRMISLLVASSVLAITSQPASAREARVDAFDLHGQGAAGVSVTLGVRVPLGTRQSADQRTTYGLSLGYGTRSGGNQLAEPVRVRQVEIARLNFDNAGARNLQLANFSLTQFGRKDLEGHKLNLSTGDALLITGGVLLVGVAAAYIAYDDAIDDWNEEGCFFAC